MGDKGKQLPTQGSSQAEVDSFLRKLAVTPSPKSANRRGRLIFAMDATASRQPTWDQACHIQAEMFEATRSLGGLDVQLVYFRGFRECRASPWVSDTTDLLKRMTAVTCFSGLTQIGRVLKHAIKETDKRKVDALVHGRRLLRGGSGFGRAQGRRAGSARSTGLHVPRGRRPWRQAHVPADRPPDQRRLLPLRPVQRQAAQGSPGRGRGVRRRRSQGAGGLRAQAWRRSAAPDSSRWAIAQSGSGKR